MLLITDGVINDLQKTIDEIVRGSSLPLSIIIVGVGKENFESMEVLDADEHPLFS
jgi:vacuolar-type H+-ATPase subunit F/Vma7